VLIETEGNCRLFETGTGAAGRNDGRRSKTGFVLATLPVSSVYGNAGFVILTGESFFVKQVALPFDKFPLSGICPYRGMNQPTIRLFDTTGRLKNELNA